MMISVVIPAYNAASTILATLDSLRCQTYRDFEVLITDDGSCDSTLELCRRFADENPAMRISLASLPHSGVSAARNHAMARAQGDYIAFLDSDDLWLPEKLARVAAAIDSDSQADLIYHDAVIILQNGQRQLCGGPPPPTELYRRLLLESNFLSTSAVTVRHSCLARAGGFDCRPDFEICEDYELWLRLAGAGARFVHVAGTLAKIVKTKGSLSSNVTRHMSNRLNVRRHYLQQAVATGMLAPSEFKRHSNRQAAHCYAAIAKHEARRRRPMEAMRAAGVAARACLHVLAGGDWQMARWLALEALRRPFSANSSTPSSLPPA